MRPTPRRNARRGVALIEVLVAGIILSISLTVLLTITGRSLIMQTNGAHQMTAAWLADDLLTMVLVEGPDLYGRSNDTKGRFPAPWDGFTYELDIDELGRGAPYRVTATVSWNDGDRAIVVETLIARREVEEPPLREPLEPVDREARYFDEEEY